MAFDFGGGAKQTARRKPATFMNKPNAKNPLEDVEYAGDLQADTQAEVDAIDEGFRERRDREQKRHQDATDTEYWAALCFRNRASKDAFLKAVGAARLGDKYIDGHHFAKLLGIDLPDDL